MIKTKKDLVVIKKSQEAKLAMREGNKRLYITVAIGDDGLQAGANEILNYFVKKLNELKLFDCSVIAGPGHKGDFDPVVVIDEKTHKTIYKEVTKELVDEIIESHILNGKIVTKALLEVEEGGK